MKRLLRVLQDDPKPRGDGGKETVFGEDSKTRVRDASRKCTNSYALG